MFFFLIGAVRTSLGNTDDVVTSDNSRNCVCLDWGRIFIATEFDILNQNGMEAGSFKLGITLVFVPMNLPRLTYIDDRLDTFLGFDYNLDGGQTL